MSKKRNFRVEAALVKRMYADYAGGMLIRELERNYDRCFASIWNVFQSRGLKKRNFRNKNPLRLGPEIVGAMYDDYQRGMSFSAVARKHGRDRRTVREVFLSRKLELRPLAQKRHPHDEETGRWLRLRRHTAREIEALIQKATRYAIPKELRWQWRLWDWDRRRDLVARLRARLSTLPSTCRHRNRPTATFSKNVIPFEYGTPEAVEIEQRLNVGRNSRTKQVGIKPFSQGVIYDGLLWFWNREGEGYFQCCGWKRRGGETSGRPVLHHVIWRKANGRPIPPGFTVVHKDGNKNNLDPANLVLKHRGDCARENITAYQLRKSRDLTAVLLRNAQEKGKKNGNFNQITALRNAA